MNVFNFLSHKYFGNSIESYIWFLAILIFGLILKRQLSDKVTRLLYILFRNQFKSIGLQKFLQLMARPIEVFFTILILYTACNRLTFPEEWNLASEENFGMRQVVSVILKSAIILSITWIILRLTDVIGLIFLMRARKTATMDDDQLVTFVKEGVKFILAAVGFFIMLGIVFKLDVVSLVTGLGIGGLAIALAAKETLENLLGSFTIFLDRPFVTGDSVKVGTVEGKVEHVGFRSTRIRALDKMIVTVPNKKMIDAELINDTDRMVRRSSMTITLKYDTTEEQLRNILNEVGNFLTGFPLIEKESVTVRFRNFSSSGLEVILIFVVLSPEMNDFLRVQEEVNYKIMSVVKKYNSAFAIPSFYKTDSDDGKTSTPGHFKTLVQGK
jgi:MscS family membrane protein